jgi:hypothetical protein
LLALVILINGNIDQDGDIPFAGNGIGKLRRHQEKIITTVDPFLPMVLVGSAIFTAELQQGKEIFKYRLGYEQ